MILVFLLLLPLQFKTPAKNCNVQGMFILISFVHQQERGKGQPLDRVKGHSDSEIYGVVKGKKAEDLIGEVVVSTLLF